MIAENSPKSDAESFLSKVEEYVDATVELFRLRLIAKCADIISSAITKLVLGFIFGAFILMLSIVTALWIGDWIGYPYSGFLVLAGFYGFLGCAGCIFRSQWIQNSSSNAIIKKMLK